MSDSRIHRFTLRFEGPLEDEFLDLYFKQSIREMRFALVMGFFLYAVFGLLDLVAVPTVLQEVWAIRFGVACPAILATLAWSFHSSFRNVSQIVIAALGVVGGVAVILMTLIAPPPASYLYQTGLMAVLMFVFSVMRLRFIYALSAALILIVVYNVIALARGGTPAWIIVNNNFFLLTATVLGGFAAYAIENYARTNYVQNRELSESRQEILQSSKRAQLIFSALADALPGTTLDDKYEVGEKIGSGGFGTVYRGKHLLLDAPVAIKIFRPTSTKDLENSFERFRLEGISAKRINHPNAVEVLDFGVSASAIAFLVMELLEGHTLADELRERGRLPARRCAEVVVPICSVLAEAHRLGIIHRDIKPANVFVHHGKHGVVIKVVDFGIAKLTENANSLEFAQLTATGAVIGTPSYMAPERLTSSYGVSSDIYSVGVLLFEMLTGALPSVQLPEAMWRLSILKKEPPAISPNACGVEIPEAMDDVVVRALSRDPAMRPTAEEMAVTIANLYDLTVSISSPPPAFEPKRIPVDDSPTVKNETTTVARSPSS